MANWARTFGKHDLSAMFLFQQSQKNYVGESANNSEKALPYRHQGIAGRITYNYDNRYFVEGNFGYNGSENFSPNHRFGFFPSIAVGYVVSNEKFFAPIRDVVSMVKLKASYGLVGNDQIGGDRRFIYNETVIGGGKYYFGTTPSQYTSVRLGEFPNPNVGWEKAKKLNLGADLSFFNQLNISGGLFQGKPRGHLPPAQIHPHVRGSEHQTLGEHRQDAQQRHRRLARIPPTARQGPPPHRARQFHLRTQPDHGPGRA